MRAAPGVAVEYDDGAIGRRLARGHEPRLQVQIVFGRERRDVGGTQTNGGGCRYLTMREVDQAALRQPQDHEKDDDAGSGSQQNAMDRSIRSGVTCLRLAHLEHRGCVSVCAWP